MPNRANESVLNEWTHRRATHEGICHADEVCVLSCHDCGLDDPGAFN